jgi:hypothetical protein
MMVSCMSPIVPVRCFFVLVDDSRWNSHGGGVGGYVVKHDGVRTYECMIADGDAAEDFRPCTNIDMPADDRCAGFAAAHADRNLLKKQTVWADAGIRVDDNAVRMGQEHSTADARVEWNVGAADSAPETVAQYHEWAQ